MSDQWAPALLFLLLSIATPIGMLAGAKILAVRAKHNHEAKYDNYECGEEPDGAAWVRFHPRYYVVALVFILFDVEAAFLFPWSLGVRDAILGDLGVYYIVDMFIFLGILFAGWAYAVRKGALEWQ